MECIFTMLCPFRRNAEVFADGHRRTFNRDPTTELAIHVAIFFHIALTFACSGRRALHNGIDERAADGFVRHSIHRQIELEQTHGAFDVHADRAGIDVCWRDEHTTYGGAVAGVRVWIEDKVGYTRRAA